MNTSAGKSRHQLFFLFMSRSTASPKSYDHAIPIVSFSFLKSSAETGRCPLQPSRNHRGLFFFPWTQFFEKLYGHLPAETCLLWGNGYSTRERGAAPAAVSNGSSHAKWVSKPLSECSVHYPNFPILCAVRSRALRSRRRHSLLSWGWSLQVPLIGR